METKNSSQRNYQALSYVFRSGFATKATTQKKKPLQEKNLKGVLAKILFICNDDSLLRNRKFFVSFSFYFISIFFAMDVAREEKKKMVYIFLHLARCMDVLFLREVVNILKEVSSGSGVRIVFSICGKR